MYCTLEINDEYTRFEAKYSDTTGTTQTCVSLKVLSYEIDFENVDEF